jgi:uncharacterized protein (DUF433 family)
MTELIIDVDEFIDDVKAGISDEALQLKHGIRGKRFQIAKAAAKDYLAKQKAEGSEPKSKVKAEQLLADVRAGIKNEDLMTIYNLTARQLQSAYRQIIGSGLASPMELSGRLSMTTSQVVEAFTEAGKAIKELE